MRRYLGYIGFPILLSLTVVHAQLRSLPLCGQSCISVGLGQSSCFASDTKCLCQSSGYITTVAECIRWLCDDSGVQQAYEFSKQQCELAGIELSVPPAFRTTSTQKSATGATSVTRPVESATGSGSAPARSTTDPAAPTDPAETTSNGPSRTQSNPAGTDTALGKEGNPSETANSNLNNNGGSSTPIGAIVGGVVGGVVALVAIVILGTWLLKREKRKKMELEMAGGPPSKPLMQADPNSQGIWEGNNAYSWNPQTNVHDVQGGMPANR